MRAALVVALLAGLSVEPAAAHCYKIWRYHFPQRCAVHEHRSAARSLRHRLASRDLRNPGNDAAKLARDIPLPPRREDAPPAPPPKTERDTGLAALRQIMSGARQ